MRQPKENVTENSPGTSTIDVREKPAAVEKKTSGSQHPDLEKAAVLVQSKVRAKMAQKKYPRKFFPTHELHDYKAFLVGNDPDLKRTDLAAFQCNEPFVIVGTSGFRAVHLACRMAANKDIVPKVIIIDNSKQVIELWKFLKVFFEGEKKKEGHYYQGLTLGEGSVPFDFYSTWAEFEKSYKDFEKFDKLYHLQPTVFKNVPRQRLDQYFIDLFKEFDPQYIKKVVKGVSVIQQDWADPATFKTIKAIYNDRPIYAYPSNIIDYLKDDSAKQQIISNIALLEPKGAIITNLDDKERVPTKTYLVTNCTESNISAEVGLTPQSPPILGKD